MNNQKHNETTWRKISSQDLERTGNVIFMNKGNLAQERAEEAPRYKVTKTRGKKKKHWFGRWGQRMLPVSRLHLVMSLPGLDPGLLLIAQPASFSPGFWQSWQSPGFCSHWHQYGLNKVSISCLSSNMRSEILIFLSLLNHKIETEDQIYFPINN